MQFSVTKRQAPPTELFWWWDLYPVKLESRLPGEISTTSDIQMTPPLITESKEELKSLLMKVKDESEKSWLKT